MCVSKGRHVYARSFLDRLINEKVYLNNAVPYRFISDVIRTSVTKETSKRSALETTAG